MPRVQQLRQTFIELMAFNEVYPNEKDVIRYVEERLHRSGATVQRDSFGNVVARLSGGDAALEPVLLSTHVDIPESAPKPQYTDVDDVITSDGTSILGADPKTGLAVILELADVLAETHILRHPVELLLTRGEEAGLIGASHADFSMLTSTMALVLDEDGPCTQVPVQAPGFVKFDGTFVGKPAHPREPKEGINALQAAVAAFHEIGWGFSAEGVTWNVGTLQAGTARNTIPGSAAFNAEMRSFSTNKLRSEMARVKGILETAAEKVGARLELDCQLMFEGYELDKKGPLFERLQRTFSGMNLTPNFFSTFGGSDANILNAKGIASVPVGSGYYDAHKYTESANLRDMDQLLDFVMRFVAA